MMGILPSKALFLIALLIGAATYSVVTKRDGVNLKYNTIATKRSITISDDIVQNAGTYKQYSRA